MNDHATQFLETYGNAGIKEILSRPTLAADIQNIQNHIEGFEPGMREEVTQTLKKILAGIGSALQDLDGDLNQHLKALRHAQENAKACIAYSNTAGRE